jgi:hypothetical protein
MSLLEFVRSGMETMMQEKHPALPDGLIRFYHGIAEDGAEFAALDSKGMVVNMRHPLIWPGGLLLPQSQPEKSVTNL